MMESNPQTTLKYGLLLAEQAAVFLAEVFTILQDTIKPVVKNGQEKEIRLYSDSQETFKAFWEQGRAQRWSKNAEMY